MQPDWRVRANRGCSLRLHRPYRADIRMVGFPMWICTFWQAEVIFPDVRLVTAQLRMSGRGDAAGLARQGNRGYSLRLHRPYRMDDQRELFRD
jgi:hypothetical protein